MKAWRLNDDPITVIADPGIDDILAFRLLEKLTIAPKQILATFGNMPVNITSQNAKQYIGASDSNWSLEFDEDATTKPSDELWIDAGQGSNGLWDIAPALNKPVSIKQPEALPSSVLSLGTLGPVEKYLKRNRGIENLLIMGGVFSRFKENGNDAELNFRMNPKAAQYVFNNTARVGQTLLVPADVAFDVAWTREKVETISQSNVMNKWLKSILLAGYNSGRYKEVNELYDPLCVLLGFYPEYANWRFTGVSVANNGKVTYDGTRSKVWVAETIINPKETSELLFSLLFDDKEAGDGIN